jgi:hypothetical protein
MREVLLAARAIFQVAARCLQPQGLDKFRWRGACLPYEDAGEMAWAHGSAPGERFNTQILVEVFSHPRLKIANRRVLARLRGQRGAELSLVPRPSKKDDEPTSDIESDGGPTHERRVAEALFDSTHKIDDQDALLSSPSSFCVPTRTSTACLVAPSRNGTMSV